MGNDEMGLASVTAAFSALIAAALSCLLVKKFCDPSSHFHWLDRPNERSLHQRPTPRTGGIGVMGGIAAGWLSAGMPLGIPFALALLLAMVSALDDAKGLPVWSRLASHLVAAGLFAWAADFTPWPLMIIVLAVVWMTNLFNFMDGADGLAGGMAVIGFGWYAVVASQSAASDMVVSSLIVAFASGAFLIFNFSPARIFMGDTGSIPLGFLAATLGAEGWMLHVWPIWFPVLVFSPFIADASMTLMRRGLRGERIWQAHREHAYQKLVRLGWSHRRVALASYVVMMAAGCSAWALCTYSLPQQWFGLGVCVVYVGLFLAIELRWRWRKDTSS